MKQEMRRKDRQLSLKEVEEILQKNEYGVLSTICADGYPYGLPLSYVYADGKLYFHHTIESGLINENISGEVKSCFTIVGNTEVLPEKFSTRYESIIAFGKIKKSVDKIEGLMHLVKKFSPDFIEKGKKYAKSAAEHVIVYEFKIEQITGKARKAR